MNTPATYARHHAATLILDLIARVTATAAESTMLVAPGRPDEREYALARHEYLERARKAAEEALRRLQPEEEEQPQRTGQKPRLVAVADDGYRGGRR